VEFDNIIDYHNKTLLVVNKHIDDHNNILMFALQDQLLLQILQKAKNKKKPVMSF